MRRLLQSLVLSASLLLSSLAMAGGVVNVRVDAPPFSIRGYVERVVFSVDHFYVNAGVWFDLYGVYPYTSFRLEGQQWSITLGVITTKSSLFLAVVYWW